MTRVEVEVTGDLHRAFWWVGMEVRLQGLSREWEIRKSASADRPSEKCGSKWK